jgi:peptide/nickel transport system substrate-binding protein
LQVTHARRRGHWGVVTPFLCLALVAASCSLSTNSPTGGTKQTLTIGDTSLGRTFNHLKERPTPLIYWTLVTQTLIHMKYDSTFGPGLATSWRYVGTGNKTFEMSIRQGVRFSDGAALNAQAVVNSMNYDKENSINKDAYPQGDIAAVDANTVRITLTDPNPLLPWLYSEAGYWGYVQGPKGISNPDLLDSQGDGVGPYVIDPAQSATGDHYTLIPNDLYYDKSVVKYSKIVLKNIASGSSLVSALQAGQIDVGRVFTGGEDAAAAAAGAGLSVVAAPIGTQNVTFVDETVAPFSDIRMRQAVNYALDRKAIATVAAGKYGQPTSEVLSSDAFDSKYQSYYAYDPAKAKSLLADAGYPNGLDLQVIVFQLGTLEQAIGQYLSAVGIRVKLVVGADITDILAKWRSGTYQLGINADGILPAFLKFSGGVQISNQFARKRVFDDTTAQLWTQAGTDPNPVPLMKQLVMRSLTQALFAPVYASDEFFFVSKHVGGVRASPSNTDMSSANWATTTITDWHSQ